MYNFLPQHLSNFWFLAAQIFLLIISGYLILGIHSGKLSRLVSWSLGILATFLTHYVNLGEAPGYRMLSIILVMFLSMKIIVANEFAIIRQRLTFYQWLLFALGWFGMNPLVFTQRDTRKIQQGWKLISYGASRIAIGFVLCIAAWLIADIKILPFVFIAIIISILLLVGLSLILHFGILNINAGIWNLFGYGTYPLFRAPLASLSLSEFWGRRWNYAFSEMTSVAIYRPLKQVINQPAALVLAFLFSGLLHELAISLPVNKGYGLTLGYFILQAIGMMAERRINFRKKSWRHLWVLGWLIIPMPLLFHPFFLKGIIWPIIGFPGN